MNCYYFDTSAFLKRYVEEKGSTYVSRMLEDGVPVILATVTYTEMLMALRKKKSEQALSPADYSAAVQDITSDWVEMNVLPIDDGFHGEVRRIADELRHDRHLKALDAIHLASALVVRQKYTDMIFMTSDRQLKHVATEFNFVVDDPEQHEE